METDVDEAATHSFSYKIAFPSHLKQISPKMMPSSSKESAISALSLLVFGFLDFLDLLLCYVYRFLDAILEEKPIPCYCHGRAKQGEEEEEGVSKTLCHRRNLFRRRSLPFTEAEGTEKEDEGELRSPRWSDCRCHSCLAWREKGQQKLHFVVMEPYRGKREERSNGSTESVLFVHGFLSSSSMWTETIFPNLSEVAKQKLRLIAVDLLGFGKSPKPANCMYRLRDHLEVIEKSVIAPLQLSSYHIVAHSMGCIVALALATKHPESVKSLTLVAPPYFDSAEEEASHAALHKLAARSVWPPLMFASAVMSWYEHIGRTVCFLFCRNHLVWEWIMKCITRKRDANFLIVDLTKHTHHSAWHSMHNVLCGGAKLMNKYLEALGEARIPVTLIQGDKDEVVPVECSYSLKAKLPFAELRVLKRKDHCSVIVGREKIFAGELEAIWFSCRDGTEILSNESNML